MGKLEELTQEKQRLLQQYNTSKKELESKLNDIIKNLIQVRSEENDINAKYLAQIDVINNKILQEKISKITDIIHGEININASNPIQSNESNQSNNASKVNNADPITNADVYDYTNDDKRTNIASIKSAKTANILRDKSAKHINSDQKPKRKKKQYFNFKTNGLDSKQFELYNKYMKKKKHKSKENTNNSNDIIYSKKTYRKSTSKSLSTKSSSKLHTSSTLSSKRRATTGNLNISLDTIGVNDPSSIDSSTLSFEIVKQEEFKCHKCRISFLTVAGLEDHIKTHKQMIKKGAPKETTCKCKYCDQVFTSNVAMRFHEEVAHKQQNMISYKVI